MAERLRSTSFKVQGLGHEELKGLSMRGPGSIVWGLGFRGCRE